MGIKFVSLSCWSLQQLFWDFYLQLGDKNPKNTTRVHKYTKKVFKRKILDHHMKDDEKIKEGILESYFWESLKLRLFACSLKHT